MIDCTLNMHRGVPHYLDDGRTIYGYFCYVCDIETEIPVEKGRDNLARPVKYAIKRLETPQ